MHTQYTIYLPSNLFSDTRGIIWFKEMVIDNIHFIIRNNKTPLFIPEEEQQQQQKQLQ